jgi:hypothetical protein
MFCLSGQKGRDAMKTDSRIGGGASARLYRHSVVSCISLLLRCLGTVPDPSAKRRVRWTPQAASTAAVLMGLDGEDTLESRFQHARACMKHDYRGRRRTGATYNGLIKALERQQHTVLPIVKRELREHGRRRRKSIDPTGRWCLLAVDGSKEDLPRTCSHETYFGIADNGICPQAFITAIVEVHTGLLWDWRIDRARASEKHHLLDMIPDLPNDALLLADAGFVGLPIWEKLNAHGTPFMIRVGGNVHLLTNLWPKTQTRQQRGIVYAWPHGARKTSPPLELRLIKVGSGRKAVYLLTNVLDPRQLSKRMAGAIYRKRWGVEVFYRTFKRTLGCAKLHSKAARRARIEFEWMLVAMAIITLLGIDALVRRRRDPRRFSPAQGLRVLRDTIRSCPLRRGQAQHALQRALGQCITDNYERRKPRQSRQRITTTNTPTRELRPPVVRPATIKEQHRALKLVVPEE